MNKKINMLTEYPFVLLSKLIEQCSPPKGASVLNLAIGEPKNDPPKKALKILKNNLDKISLYPTINGTEELRKSYVNWLVGRFSLTSYPDYEKNVLPVSGTREGIFSFIQATLDSSKKRKTVVMTNPFYKIYEGAALLAGADCFFIDCSETNNFKPDFNSVPKKIWQNCQILVLCSPSNPTGVCLTIEDFEIALGLAEKYDFLICSDECYIDIYSSIKKPPKSLLNAGESLNLSSRTIVFHSLSKRSNLAGLRSGFVCAHEKIIEKVHLYRTYHGVTLPFPSQAASAWAWKDQAHVEENRLSYDEKFNSALIHLKNFSDVSRPQGAFYLWLETPIDDQVFTQQLYENYGLIVLPGSYLGIKNPNKNPGTNFVRVAIVHDLKTIYKAFKNIAKSL